MEPMAAEVPGAAAGKDPTVLAHSRTEGPAEPQPARPLSASHSAEAELWTGQSSPGNAHGADGTAGPGA